MERSISVNPKLNRTASVLLETKEGLITKFWRARISEFYKSLIPSTITESQQIWLRSSSDIVEFEKKIRKEDYDLSNIKFVCIIESIADLYDIIDFFSILRNKLPSDAKILCTNFNWLLAPIFRLSGLLGFSRNRPYGNLFRSKDLKCFLEMSGCEIVRDMRRFFFPIKIPLLSPFFDNFLIRLPILKHLALNQILIIRKMADQYNEDKTVTVLIPCKNEEANIRAAVTRISDMGKSVEILFINDKSTDNTVDVINKCKIDYPEKNIILVDGPGNGKGEAIREGMKHATGDICMILDADLTVIPEDLPQFYYAIKNRRADFIYGSRLIYAQEHDSMRFANIIGNIFFSNIFSFILEQRTTDTLCGTKVYWRKDWPLFEEMKKLLKDSDRWGDYNLIFGAAHFGLKISQLPVRYFERLEGLTKMDKRIRNGLIMLRVAWYALWRIKFNS